MGLFGNLFSSKPSNQAVIFLDVGADSVAGACVNFASDKPPFVAYSKRLPIDTSAEKGRESIERTLSALGSALVAEGAPALMRVTGSGRASTILVSLDAPWADTAIRSEKIERNAPFIFSKAILQAAVAKAAELPKGRVLADESVVATMLDGYEAKKAIGLKASRISVIILSSSVDEPFAKTIGSKLRELYHGGTVHFISAASVRYQALKALFPHEEDYVVLDAAANSINVALVRRGVLVSHAAESIQQGGEAQEAVVLDAIKKTLAEITKRYPLPRTVLLIAADQMRDTIKKVLESNMLGSFRLTDDPPSVIPISASHLTDLVKNGAEATPDLALSLMALFWRDAQK